MGRKSRIEQLPSELRADVDRLIREGRTIAQIRAHLATMGEEVSNGAAGRYIKRANEQLASWRESQAVAGMWVKELGENPHSDIGCAVAEVLKVVAHLSAGSLLQQASEEGGKPIKVMDLMLATQALKNLESVAKQSMDRKEREKKAALAAAAETVREVGQRRGVSPDTITEIERELGLL